MGWEKKRISLTETNIGTKNRKKESQLLPTDKNADQRSPVIRTIRKRGKLFSRNYHMDCMASTMYFSLFREKRLNWLTDTKVKICQMKNM